MSSPLQVLEQTLQAWPLTEAHRRLLADVGLGAADLARVDLGSVPTWERPAELSGPELARRDLLAFGVRDARGTLVTLRVLDARAPFSAPVYDFAAQSPLAEQADEQADEYAERTNIDRSGFRHSPIPHVAFPTQSERGTVMVVDDDLSAALLAARLGVPVVSTLGGRLVGPALKVAAKIAHGGTLVVAVRRRYPDPQDRTFSRVVALAGTRAREVRVADWEGPESLAEAVLANRDFATQAAPRAFAVPPGEAALSPCVVPLPSFARHPAAMLETAAVRVGWAVTRSVLWAADACAPLRTPPRLGPPGPAYVRALQAVAQAADLVAASGGSLFAIGGLAVDAIVGGVVRERRDVDLLAIDMSDDAMEGVAEALVRLGFPMRRRSRGRYFNFDCGSITIEMFRGARDRDGRLVFANAFQYCAFHPEAAQGGRRNLYGTAVPVLVPEYLYLMLAARNHDASTLAVRSELVRKRRKIDDLRALRLQVDRARLRLIRRADRFRCCSFEPDPIRAAEAEIASAVAQVKRRVGWPRRVSRPSEAKLP